MSASAAGVPPGNLPIWLYKLRTSRGLSQEGLALRAGIAVPTYGRLERINCRKEASHVSLDTFLRVVDALDLTSQELWTLVVTLKPPRNDTVAAAVGPTEPSD